MKLVQKRSKKTGLPPGTLVHIGEKKTDKVTITAFNYAGDRCDERKDVLPDALAPPTDESVIWVDVGGIHKMDILESFGTQFQLHPLLLERTRSLVRSFRRTATATTESVMRTNVSIAAPAAASPSAAA